MASDIFFGMHVPLLEALHLTCLKTPPQASDFSMIGCRLSRERIVTLASLAESSNSIVNPSNLVCIVYTYTRRMLYLQYKCLPSIQGYNCSIFHRLGYIYSDSNYEDRLMNNCHQIFPQGNLKINLTDKNNKPWYIVYYFHNLMHYRVAYCSSVGIFDNISQLVSAL